MNSMHQETSSRVFQLKDYTNSCERATEKLSSELRTQDLELVSSIINLGSDSAKQEYKYGLGLLRIVDEWIDAQKRETEISQLAETNNGFFLGITKAIELQKKAQENCKLISLLKNDNNIIKVAILNTIEGYCVFVQLNDFSHDGHINTRKQLSTGIKQIYEDYVPFYFFSKDDQFPEEDFSFIWKR